MNFSDALKVHASRPIYYILEGREPVACPDFFDWAKRDHCIHVGDDTIGTVRISTVFLGQDHAYRGMPELFETMIFGGPLDEYQERYSTWDQAAAGHVLACELVRRTPAWRHWAWAIRAWWRYFCRRILI